MVCGWGKGKLFVGPTDTTGIPFGPQIKPNDTISVHVNFKSGEVVYYRNGAFVGMAIGRKGSNAGQHHHHHHHHHHHRHHHYIYHYS